MDQYNFRGPTFPLTGFFDGKGNEPAERWLRKFDVEVLGYADANGKVPPVKYIRSLIILLRGIAVTWVEIHPIAGDVIKNKDPGPDDAMNFVNLLKERFFTNSVNVAFIPLSVELANLFQKANEFLSSYYHRTTNIMSRFGARNPLSPGFHAAAFIQINNFTFDSIVQAFVKNIEDLYVRKQVYKSWPDDLFLKNIYNVTEQARRSKAEVTKRMVKKAKDVELDQFRFFVKNLPIQHLSPMQMETVKSTYASNPSEMPKWLRQASTRRENFPMPFPPVVYRENIYRPADQKQSYVPRIQYEFRAKPFQPRRLLREFLF